MPQAEENYVTIPYQYTQNGLIHLPIQIDGVSYLVKLDTGTVSDTLFLHRDILKKHKATPLEEKAIRCNVKGKLFTTQFFQVKSVNLGAYQLVNFKGEEYIPWLVRGPRRDDGTLEKEKIDGIIGFNFFALLKIKKLIIDYRKNNLILVKEGGLPAEYKNMSWSSVPFTFEAEIADLDSPEITFHGSYVRKGHEDIPLKLALDLGDSFPIDLSQKWLERHHLLPIEKLREKKGILRLGDEFQKELAGGRYGMLGELVSERGALGNEFFKENVLVLDLEKKVLEIAQ